ncbi:MAG: hypothetical protein H6702_16355 [Myxococcales bacterium]|nr:hypothetical protein [Myxococcales bacterium]
MAGNERNEQSMLISLDSLTADSPNQKGSGAAGDGGSGLIDLAGLGSAGLAPGEESPGLVAPAFQAAAPTYVKPKSSFNPLVVVGVAVGVVALLGGGIYFGMQMGGGQAEQPGTAPASVASAAPSAVTSAAASTAPDGAAVGSTAASAVAEAPGEAPGSAPESVAAADGQADQAAKDEAAKAEADKPKRVYTPAEIAAWKKKQAEKKAAEEAEAAKKAAEAAKAEAAKPKAPAGAPAKTGGKDEVDDMLSGLSGKKPAAAAQQGGGNVVAPDDPLLPKKLGKAQILGVVRQNAGAVAGCKGETKSEGGTVFVDMQIVKSGSVEAAKVVGAQAGTPLANCVERKVKVFRFPQFNGPPMRIKLPFAM